MKEVNAKDRPALVFVHGLTSSSDCWKFLVNRFKDDKRIAEQFELYFFEYPTSWLEINPKERIPSHDEIANCFQHFLDSDRFAGRELTLVGHSQGGLIIHTYLAKMADGRAPQLKDVRQVVTIATPHAGSLIGAKLQRLVFSFFDNPQVRALRPLNSQTAEAIRIVANRIATTPFQDSNHWPIPVYTFGGMQDNIVIQASAQGSFVNYKALRGTHSTVLEPDEQDYEEIIEVLCDPAGHPHVFEVEHYETSIKVRPERKSICLREGWDPILTDNVCELKRIVQFAKQNYCRRPFKIRYKTGRGSYLKADCSPRNEAGQLNAQYEERRESFEFLFSPREIDPSDGYWLWLEIYNGFGEGRRDVHFHIGSELSQGSNAYYRRLTYMLDLSEYLEAGYSVETPSFYLHSEEGAEGCGSWCASRRRHGTAIPPDEMPREGVWVWNRHGIRQGIADLFWEIA